MALRYPQVNIITPPEPQTKAAKFFSSIDIFKFTPTPQLHPVTTTCSKIGSLLFLLALIGFFVYDVYLFFEKNVPITNGYQVPAANTGQFYIPDVGFAIYYYNSSSPSVKDFLVNPSIMSMSFKARVNKNNSTYASINVPLIPCTNLDQAFCPNTTALLIAQSNLTTNPNNFSFVDVSNDNLLMSINQTQGGEQYRMLYKFTINLCQNSSANNFSCLSQYQINSVLSKSVFRIRIQQPKGFDSRTGQPVSPNSVIFYQYNLSPSSTNTIQLSFQPTKFIYHPDLFLFFKQQSQVYTRMNEQIAITEPITSIPVTVNMLPYSVMNQIDIQFKTSVEALALWFSFTKMILTLGLIIFVGFNRRRFAKLNPEWHRFDIMFDGANGKGSGKDGDELSKEYEMTQINYVSQTEKGGKNDKRDRASEPVNPIQLDTNIRENLHVL